MHILTLVLCRNIKNVSMTVDEICMGYNIEDVSVLPNLRIILSILNFNA